MKKFNFNIDQLNIEDNEEDFSLSKQQYKSKSMKQEYIENNLFVDLGLPSGTKWCKYNLGCNFELLSSDPESTSPKDWYGKYYAWGETEDKDRYSWETYEYAKNDYNELTKYCSKSIYGYKNFTDDLTELELEDDIAFQMNYDWKIPTKEQCQELLDYTDNKWISGKDNNLYMNAEGLRGRLFTSKINGNQIFIPAAGLIDGSSLISNGFYGSLWSSSLNIDHPYFVWHLYFDSDSFSSFSMGCYHRNIGQSVRPVLKQK